LCNIRINAKVVCLPESNDLFITTFCFKGVLLDFGSNWIGILICIPIAHKYNFFIYGNISGNSSNKIVL